MPLADISERREPCSDGVRRLDGTTSYSGLWTQLTPGRHGLGRGQADAQSTVVGQVGSLASDDFNLMRREVSRRIRSEVVAIRRRDDEARGAYRAPGVRPPDRACRDGGRPSAHDGRAPQDGRDV